MQLIFGLAFLSVVVGKSLKVRGPQIGGPGDSFFAGQGNRPSSFGGGRGTTPSFFGGGRGNLPNSFGDGRGSGGGPAFGNGGGDGYGQGYGPVKNDIVSEQVQCKSVTVLYAKEFDAAGNVGTGMGPRFFQALAGNIGEQNLAVQGVDYDGGQQSQLGSNLQEAPPSNLQQLNGGGDSSAQYGVIHMLHLFRMTRQQCEGTKIVISGHGYGCKIVHWATEQMSAEEVDISSVVLFNDPDENQPVGNISPDKVAKLCRPDDDSCRPATHPQNEQVSWYYAEQAAQFVAQRTRVSVSQFGGQKK